MNKSTSKTLAFDSASLFNLNLSVADAAWPTTPGFNEMSAAVTGQTAAANTAPSFAPGYVVTDMGSYAYDDDTASSVVRQTDGKLVVAGYTLIPSDSVNFTLARYNPNGTLDTSFGSGGKVITNLGDYGYFGYYTDDHLYSVLQQADGKLLAAGESDHQFAMARYNLNGTLDTSFGTGGVVYTDIGDYFDFDGINSALQQADGKLVAAGYSGGNFALVRYNTNGTLDTSFGTGGKVITDLGGDDQITSAVLQADGKLVVAGIASKNGHDDFALARYNTNGTLDTSFGTGGKVVTDLGGDDQITSAVLQADGKLVVAGIVSKNGHDDFALARYNTNGTLDTNFGTVGKVITDLGGDDQITSMVRQPDGKLVVAGYTYKNYHYDFALARYNTNGTLDLSYGYGGKVITTWGSNDSINSAVALETDGKLMAAGTASYFDNNDYHTHSNFALARYNADGTQDFQLGDSSSAMSTSERAAAKVINSQAQIHDAELDALNGGQGNYAGSSLSLARHGGANASDMFSATGTLSLANNRIVLDGADLGSSQQSGGQLVLHFTAGLQQQIDSVMQQLAYSNSSHAAPASVQLDWTFNDGNSAHPLSTTATTTVHITPVNDPSTGYANISGTVAAGQTLTASNTFSDPDGLGAVSYTWQVSTDHGSTWISVGTGSSLLLNTNLASQVLGLIGSYTDGQGFANQSLSLLGTAGSDKLSGGNGNDRLSGGDGNDTINGGNGDDILIGGVGNDTFYGGNGIDTAQYADATAAVTVNLGLTPAQNTGGAGTDTLSYIENLTGSAFNDTLTGDGGNNVLSGGNGNDILSGGGGYYDGNDTLDGGNGVDTADYSNVSYYSVTVNLSLTTAQNTGYYSGTDTLLNIENVNGSSNNDTLTGNSGDNVLFSKGGNDTLIGGDGNDTLDGGKDNDTLDGGSGIDWAGYADATAAVTVNLSLTTAQNTGGAGTDTLRNIENLIGGAFNDSLTGNTGTNVLNGGNGNDSLWGGAGDDTLDGGNGVDTAQYTDATAAVTVNLNSTTAQNTGGAGKDTLRNIENLTGSAYNDSLTGNSGANVLNGGDGNDSLLGAAGDDTLNGGNGVDIAQYWNATAGVTINLSLTTAQNTGGAGVDTLSNIENVQSSDYNDVLTGSSSANVLLARAGNDLINGGLGNDTLTGGAGQDTFLFNSDIGSGNLDTLTDFVVADDTIQLENAIFTTLTTTGVLAASAFKILGSGGVVDGDDRILYNTSTGGLFYDADGSGAGAAVQIAVLGKSLAMTNADFVIV